MQKFVPALFAAGVLVSRAAQAAELRPMEASSIVLGDVSGVAYYTAENDGYRMGIVNLIGSGRDKARGPVTQAPMPEQPRR